MVSHPCTHDGLHFESGFSFKRSLTVLQNTKDFQLTQNRSTLSILLEQARNNWTQPSITMVQTHTHTFDAPYYLSLDDAMWVCIHWSLRVSRSFFSPPFLLTRLHYNQLDGNSTGSLLCDKMLHRVSTSWESFIIIMFISFVMQYHLEWKTPLAPEGTMESTGRNPPPSNSVRKQVLI